MQEQGLYCVIKEDFCVLVVKTLMEQPDTPTIDTRACLNCPYYLPYLAQRSMKKVKRPILPTPNDHPDTRPVRPNVKDPFRW